MTQTVPDISPLMPMHQDPLLVIPLWGEYRSPVYSTQREPWCFLCSCSQQAFERIFELLLIWDAMVPMWRCCIYVMYSFIQHYEVIKWKHFPRYWPFVRGIHRSPVNSPHKGQWRGALMFSLICVWINGWVNNREAGDLRRYRAHYDVAVIGLLNWHRGNRIVVPVPVKKP